MVLSVQIAGRRGSVKLAQVGSLAEDYRQPHGLHANRLAYATPLILWLAAMAWFLMADQVLAQGHPRGGSPNGRYSQGYGPTPRAYAGFGVANVQGPGWVGGTYTSGGMITYNVPISPYYFGYGWGNYGAIPYNSGWGMYGPGMAGPIGGYSWGVEPVGVGIGPSVGANVYTSVWTGNGFQNQYVGSYGGLGPLGGSVYTPVTPNLPSSGAIAGPGIQPVPVIGNGAFGPQGDLQGAIPDQFGIDAALVQPAQRPVAASSPESKIKSLEAQSLGDHWVRQQQWAKAFSEFRKAVSLADDRGEAHFHMGMCLAAMGRHSAAVGYLKRAFYLQPELASNGPSLSMFFGAENDLVRLGTIHKASDWVREDIRDPDRLFLLGCLLHFDRDPRSVEVLEAGLEMAGRGPHFEVLLRSQLIAPPVAPGQELVNNPQNPLDQGQAGQGLAGQRQGLGRAAIPGQPQNGQGAGQRFSAVNPPTSSYTVIQPRGARGYPNDPAAGRPTDAGLPRSNPPGSGAIPTPSGNRLHDLPRLPTQSGNPLDQQPPAPRLDEPSMLPPSPSPAPVQGLGQGSGGAPLPLPPEAPIPDFDPPGTQPSGNQPSGGQPLVVPPAGNSQPKTPAVPSGPLLPPPTP